MYQLRFPIDENRFNFEKKYLIFIQPLLQTSILSGDVRDI